MTNPRTKGNGRNYRWLLDHANHIGDECLIWPFGRVRGYGYFSYCSQMMYANGENQIDRRLHGTKNAGYRHKTLTEYQVLEIIALSSELTQDELAHRFNTCRRNIGAVLSGKTWTHIPRQQPNKE